jgi:hypothetical protein
VVSPSEADTFSHHYQAGYDFSFWLIAGLILAKFVGPKTAGAG